MVNEPVEEQVAEEVEEAPERSEASEQYAQNRTLRELERSPVVQELLTQNRLVRPIQEENPHTGQHGQVELIRDGESILIRVFDREAGEWPTTGRPAVDGMEFDEETYELRLTRTEGADALTLDLSALRPGLVIPGIGIPANDPPDRTYSADAELPGLIYAHDFTVEAGVTLTCADRVGTMIVCTGRFKNDGVLDANGCGGRGGYRGDLLAHGENGIPDDVLESIIATGGGSGSGSGFGGGGSGSTSTERNGEAGPDPTLAILRLIATVVLDTPGTPLGGGGGRAQNLNGRGGNGGGAILVIASELENNGTLQADGMDAATVSSGAGNTGGGGGGLAAAFYETLLAAGTMTAAGGIGDASGGDGGAGITGAVSIYGG